MHGKRKQLISTPCVIYSAEWVTIKCMNYVSHAFITSEVFPDANDAQVFGSMIPDLVGMAGTKLERGVDDRHLREGIELHIATDSVFDPHPEFMDIKVKYGQIHGEVLPNGAARLAADPGTEMLLDGFTLQKDRAAQVYKSAIQAALNKEFPYWQGAKDPATFTAFCMRHAEVGVPYMYADPLIVAQRLHRRVASRPRLAFDEKYVKDVARVFELQQADIGRIANALIVDTIEALRAPAEDTAINIGPVADILPGISVAIVQVNESHQALLHRSEELTTKQSATGRYAARQALQQLGLENATIPKGNKGEPQFPDGFVGTISHSKDWAVALACTAGKYSSLGVDLEKTGRQFNSQRVATDIELEALGSFDAQASLVIASVKEAYYKAIFPFVGRFVGFREVEVTMNDDARILVHPVSSQLTRELEAVDVDVHVLNDGRWLMSICVVS